MSVYVCGHEADELERLALQAEIYERPTRELFTRAGLAPGMRVLDLGSGAGDVSLLAAKLVGAAGGVVGIDRDARAVAAAARRATERGLDNVTFVRAELAAWTPESPFDALVGRFVLMHQPDPASALRAALRHVRPDGVVAFIESQMSASVAGAHSWPHSATYERALGWMRAVITAAGAHADMGLRLRASFLDAGLPEPELRLSAEPQGGPGAPVYRYIAESVRSMAPLMARFGIATPSPADLDELAAMLERETVQANGVLVPPIVVGASARTR